MMMTLETHNAYRYHIVEEFNRGIYDYLIASDESQLRGEMDSEDEQDDDEEEEADKPHGKHKVGHNISVYSFKSKQAKRRNEITKIENMVYHVVLISKV